MAWVCSTRSLKNAKFIQGLRAGVLPPSEPLEGFGSLVPMEVLGRLHRADPHEFEDEDLARVIEANRPPNASATITSPLFTGTVMFVRATLSSKGNEVRLPEADLQVAIRYAVSAAPPLSDYCSQYGPNRLEVGTEPLDFNASTTGGRYNDQILAGWVDEIAQREGLGEGKALVFLNPPGFVNSDADPGQGVLGYHGISHSRVPYAFVNVGGGGLTVDDGPDYFALALSHELAETTADPRADGSNPEVADGCAGNCGVDNRNYFDSRGNWLGARPTQGYHFFTCGVAKPAFVTKCPAPPGACSYAPEPSPARKPAEDVGVDGI